MRIILAISLCKQILLREQEGAAGGNVGALNPNTCADRERGSGVLKKQGLS